MRIMTRENLKTLHALFFEHDNNYAHMTTNFNARDKKKLCKIKMQYFNRVNCGWLVGDNNAMSIKVNEVTVN